MFREHRKKKEKNGIIVIFIQTNFQRNFCKVKTVANNDYFFKKNYADSLFYHK